MAYITKLAFMNEYYAYGRINIWGSKVSTYWKITWKYDMSWRFFGGSTAKKRKRKLA
jgi:hypothetical protein